MGLTAGEIMGLKMSAGAMEPGGRWEVGVVAGNIVTRVDGMEILQKMLIIIVIIIITTLALAERSTLVQWFVGLIPFF